MQIERGLRNTLVENHLPDGSRILVDCENETVFVLNATAGAAWDACTAPTNLFDVTKEMQRSFCPAVTERLAEAAVLQLERQNLVIGSADARQAVRRALPTKLGGVALPLVVAMTFTEQRAHAAAARSTVPHAPQPMPVFAPEPPGCGMIQRLIGRYE